MPAPIAETIATLRTSVDEVRRGELSPARGQAIASLSRALVAAWEVHATEVRIDALEAQVLAVTNRPHLRSVGP
jgi:hypothetical protein